MSFRERIAKRFFGSVIEGEVMERLKAANMTDEDEGWRRITGDSTRQLNEVTQDRMIEISYWLWKYNPLANWIIEITTAFVVGDGLTIEAKNDDVQEVIDKFWDDPVNAMKLHLKKHTRELGIYGELCLPKFVGENSGRVRVGFFDPAQIKSVITDPHNCKMRIAVLLKGTGGKVGRKFKTVLPEGAEEVLSDKAKIYRDQCKDGEVYFDAINNVTNEPRGTSDLFVLADWLDAYEQFLYDYADKWPLLNSFVWDLLVEGADENEIKKALKNFTKKSGSIYGHNEKQKLEAVTPDLKAVDAEKGARLLRNHIMGNTGFPEHWYGGGGDVNRATAVEMGAPAFRMLSDKQAEIISIFSFILEDVIFEAGKAGMLDGVEVEERTFTVSAPPLAAKDITGFATAVQELTTALISAENQEWIDKDTGVKAFAFCLGLIGYELDVEAIQEELDKEKKDEGYEDYTKKDKNGKE